MAIFFAITFVVVITIIAILFQKNKQKPELQICYSHLRKDDNKAKQLIWIFSIVVFVTVVLLGKFKLEFIRVLMCTFLLL